METTHSHVRHPREVLQAARQAKRQRSKTLYYNDVFLEWITDHILASITFFDVALIIPLLAIPAPSAVKITVGVISGSWIQLWALPAIQRSQNKTQAQNDAKAEVDHETLTYLATLQDRQMLELQGLNELLKKAKNR